MTTTHNLKCAEPWFSRVRDGDKTVEIRKHDRDFQVGDRIRLVPLWADDGYHTEQDDEGKDKQTYHRAGQPKPVGEDVFVEVTHVVPHHLFADGLMEGYCALSVRRTDSPKPAPDALEVAHQKQLDIYGGGRREDTEAVIKAYLSAVTP